MENMTDLEITTLTAGAIIKESNLWKSGNGDEKTVAVRDYENGLAMAGIDELAKRHGFNIAVAIVDAEVKNIFALAKATVVS